MWGFTGCSYSLAVWPHLLFLSGLAGIKGPTQINLGLGPRVSHHKKPPKDQPTGPMGLLPGTSSLCHGKTVGTTLNPFGDGLSPAWRCPVWVVRVQQGRGRKKSEKKSVTPLLSDAIPWFLAVYHCISMAASPPSDLSSGQGDCRERTDGCSNRFSNRHIFLSIVRFLHPWAQETGAQHHIQDPKSGAAAGSAFSVFTASLPRSLSYLSLLPQPPHLFNRRLELPDLYFNQNLN